MFPLNLGQRVQITSVPTKFYKNVVGSKGTILYIESMGGRYAVGVFVDGKGLYECTPEQLSPDTAHFSVKRNDTLPQECWLFRHALMTHLADPTQKLPNLSEHRDKCSSCSNILLNNC